MIHEVFSPEIAYFGLFLVSLWLSGTLFEQVLRCRLLGELLIGIIFGNLGIGTLLPADKTVFVLAGDIGVLGLIFEAGLSTGLHKLLRAGPRGALVALVGTMVPLATGYGYIYALLQQHAIQDGGAEGTTPNIVTEALASGAALASTSVACAISLMKQQGLLETSVGTLITTAAMIDDIASLILLGIVAGFGGSESDIGAMTIVQPILSSLGVILVGLLGCIAVTKSKTRQSVKQATEMRVVSEAGQENSSADAAQTGKEEEEITDSPNIRRHEALYKYTFSPAVKLAAVLTVGLGYSILAEYLGSSRLLGAFVAGVFFSPFEALKALYDEQISHKLQPAMSAIFFATIGFAIPLSKILDPSLFGWGVVYAVIASLAKLVTALLAPSEPGEAQYSSTRKQGLSERWMVGTAMIARGELGLLMVQQALLQGVMTQAVMIVTTWSIILCTLVGIGALSLVMRKISVQRQD
ncbi:Cation/H+ exchanger [Gamsiella multidivaricata]|uniref:Cation/H+ exchanger n=1 Tax=Gamsiella multidivaricata TaxID=101098 RepID=UPI00221E5936|nr:Cation/H+ exchanger [Gamsiella multidivaricata]KAG0364453.1 hypothetical protein BGZ54_007514 [Gamsiella multidivaricata]KAI7832601.1 Cation/H+ exchanger [Gamsiella multidivaricata]